MPLCLFPPRLLVLFVSVATLGLGCLPLSAGRVVVTGDLHGDLIWSGEIYIGGDVTLARDARLNILPGTTIRFLPPEEFPGGENDHPHFPGGELNVLGTLTAIGTATAPIVFAAAEASAPSGSWGAVNFAEGAGGTFSHCVFRQADSAVHSREATVKIAESLFENNLVGIRFHTSAMRVEHNLLRNNGTGLRFHFGAPVIRFNRFEHNRINLFVTAHPQDYLVECNRFGIPLDYQVVLGEDVPEDVDLAGNDWDGLPAAAVAERTFDGQRTPYLGRVRIEPIVTVPPDEAGPSWIR